MEQSLNRERRPGCTNFKDAVLEVCAFQGTFAQRSDQIVQAAPDLCGALRVAVQQTAESDTAAMVKETALAVALTLLRGVHESARAVFAQHMRMADLPAYLGGLEQHIAAVERESQRPE
eukprot:TRINITY_DN22807_c0_g2_i3.p1 TRINITY_DN22807_c0_g2~~TRINITY_DN22807_c0_g2_i3.p1  ORF type:complete len:119 (-),score=20.01 TRINITY_DN22807_c0_g2_i3:519-875(-)